MENPSITLRLKPLTRLWQRLIEPVATLTDADERIRARFLAQLFLIAAILWAVVMTGRYLLFPNVPQILLRLLVVWGGTAFLLLPYFVVRSGQVFIAGLILIVHVMLILIAQLLLSVSDNAFQTTLTFMLVVILFASHFHSIRLTITVAILQLGLLLLLPLIIPVFTYSEMLRGPIPLQLVMSTMTVIFAYYRDKIQQAQHNLLVESEARFKMVSDFIPNYAFSIRVEPNGTVRNEWVTEEFAQITGYTLADVNDNIANKIFHPDDLPRYIESIQQTYKGQSGSGEYRIITKSGETRWLRISRNVVWDKDANRLVRYYGVAQDITIEIQTADQQLNSVIQGERSKLIHDFVTAFSHDFRTSLATIETSRYLADRFIGTAQTEQAITKLNTIHRSVNHMSAQLENLSAIATLGNLKLEPFDLNALVDEVISQHTDKARHNNQIIAFEPTEKIPLIKADADEISRALRELVRNALSFTPAGGMVTLKTACIGNEVNITIQDTGIGIAPEHLNHIFELFYRVDSARNTDSGGVGLGLSVARMIISAHAGNITVSSTPAVGSAFTIHLPKNGGQSQR